LFGELIMANILRNPTLSGFTLGRYFTEKNGAVGTIEYPLEWEFVAAIRDLDDPEKLPQSLHREQGFAISAGYRAWEGGFVQHNVPLAGGTRYLAKAGFVPHVGFSDGRVDLSAVTWRLMIETPLGTVAQEWQMTQKGSFEQYEEIYLTFDCGQDTTANFHFQARSPWAGNVCELQVFACSLEAVANDGSPAPMIGQSGTFKPTPAPILTLTQPPPPHVAPREDNPPPHAVPANQPTSAPIGQPTPPRPIMPIGQTTPLPPAPIGARGGMTSTEDPYALLNELAASPDFDGILNGLRNANQWTQDATLITGFARLAKALEGLKR
jgi:hypothetical protein